MMVMREEGGGFFIKKNGIWSDGWWEVVYASLRELTGEKMKCIMLEIWRVVGSCGLLKMKHKEGRLLFLS